MKDKTNDDIIKEEIDAILKDILDVYYKSGRKVSGTFAEGLSAVYEPNKGTIKGYVYLAGRGRTKKKGKAGEPTVAERILQWLKDRSLASKIIAESKAKSEKAKTNALRGVAYAIAKKIHEQGTNSSEWLKIYEKVITPQRIDEIIERISVLNVNKIINNFNVELEALVKNV